MSTYSIETRDGSPGISSKVAALSDPGCYSPAPDGVEVVETHMSYVFLTDRHAYKLKKPVRSAFLDFSTVEARRRDGRCELRLNRRLAPDVYLALPPLTQSASGDLAIDGGGEVVDWLVQMRRLPADRMLDVMIERDAVRRADVERLGWLLARFYAELPAAETSPDDYIERLKRDVDNTRRELTDARYGMDGGAVDRIAAALKRVLRGERGVFEQRVADGRIIEGHGDLRPEHVCLEPAGPVVFDCLEFNAELRTLDAASDLSFLSLECGRLGAAWIGEAVLDIYSRQSDDAPPAALLCFYRGLHALLRAKIAAWHLNEPNVENAEKWTRKARSYLTLAEGELALE